jgi:hypothetical protein
VVVSFGTRLKALRLFQAALKVIRVGDRNALVIFSALFLIYLLSFNGQFTSIDELNLYSMAESLVQTGSVAVPQVSFAAYHNPVGGQEAGFPLAAAPLYWLAVRTPFLNNIYTVMMLNPFLVALTAAFIYLCARKLGSGAAGSTLAALAYGLGSLGWPYAQSFYRELLVGCLWVAGLYGLLSWRAAGAAWRGPGAASGMLGCVLILLSIFVKVNTVFAAPFLLLAVLRGRAAWPKRAYFIIGAAGAVLLALFLLIVQWREGTSWFYAVAYHLVPDPLAVLAHFYGLLLSPIKGLILYMPAAILAAPGLYYLRRKQPYAAWAIGLAFLALAGAASIYTGWYGGQSWGPRLLLPAIPVLLIPVASLWDSGRHWLGRSLILGVLLLSAVIQAAVVTNGWWKAYSPFLMAAEAPHNTIGLSYRYVALSPPWVALRDWSASDLGLLWMQVSRKGKWHIQWEIGLALFACLAAVLALGRTRLARKFALLALVPMLLAAVFFQVAGANVSGGYIGLSSAEAQAIARWVRPADPAPYTLVTMSNEFHIYFFEGWLKGDFVHHWYSPSQTEEFEEILDSTKGTWLSFVADRVHIQPTDSGKDLEGWLTERLYRFGSRGAGGYDLVYFGLLPSASWAWEPLPLEIGPFQFRQFAVSATQLYPGDVLGVQLEVCKSGDVPVPHALFVHLAGARQTLEGSDGPIRYGTLDLGQWKMGECLTEKRGIYIPSGAGAGQYNLILGAYTPDGPVMTTDEAGQPAAYRTLKKITIGK